MVKLRYFSLPKSFPYCLLGKAVQNYESTTKEAGGQPMQTRIFRNIKGHALKTLL